MKIKISDKICFDCGNTATKLDNNGLFYCEDCPKTYEYIDAIDDSGFVTCDKNGKVIAKMTS